MEKRIENRLTTYMLDFGSGMRLENIAHVGKLCITVVWCHSGQSRLY